MIGGEEGGCLAVAAKPNKNLNSSYPDRGDACDTLQLDKLPSHVQQLYSNSPTSQPRAIYRVMALLITTCRFRVLLPECVITPDTSEASHRVYLPGAPDMWGSPSESCEVTIACQRKRRTIR